jgi:hypothetical protein
MKEFKSMTWQLGLLTDSGGHVHLGAVVADDGSERAEYVDLLAPVGASKADDLHLDQLLVLVRGEHVADLRRLAETCIDDIRLRDRLVELADLATSYTVSVPWTV